MNESTLRPETIRPGWVFPAVLGVLIWRVLAYLWPSSMITIADVWRLPITLLGLWFLVVGVSAWWVRPNRWTMVFLVYTIGGAVHWGGAIGAAHPALEISLLFAYVALTAMSDVALLHLALIYPSGRALRGWRLVIYAPVAVSLLLAASAALLPLSLLQTAVGLILWIANLISIAGAIVFIVRLFTAGATMRRAARLPWIVAGLLIGGVVAELGASRVLPGEPDAWNLMLGLIPLALALALVTSTADPARQAGAASA